VLNRLDDAFLASVREKSRYLFQTFTGAKGVQAVSGLGLMIGIKTAAPAAQVVQKCIERGVLCLTAKDRVRLLPALNIPMDTLKKAAEIILSVCAEEAD
jgi:acetylornithine/N-succinyldiaminopimelate aminotransferase